MIEKPKLLLLEDSDKGIDLIMDSLSEYFDVTWAKDQFQLEEKINAKFQVIVTDVSINNCEKQGFQLIDDLRVKMRITRIPIVVYSANVNIEDIEEDQGKLFCGYVDKGNDMSGDVLLKTCIDCAKERQNVVSMNVWEGQFTKLGKLNHPLSDKIIGDLKFLGIYDIKTIKDLITQLKNDIENSEWKSLEDLLWIIWLSLKNNRTK
jgi:CheY-like chemotaxis protein